MPEQGKMQRPAEDKAVQPAEDKAVQPAEDKAVQPAEDKALKADPKPRFEWRATSADGKEATHGRWRVRVQQLGGTGLWRPFVEFVGDDYPTEDRAEKALERLLK